MLYNIFHEFSFRLFPNFNAKKSKNHWTSLTTFRLLSCKEVHFLYMKNLILISVWSTLTALYQKPTSQHLIRINNTDFTTSFAATSSLHVRAVRETGFLWELLLWVAGGLSSLGLVMSVCLSVCLSVREWQQMREAASTAGWSQCGAACARRHIPGQQPLWASGKSLCSRWSGVISEAKLLQFLHHHMGGESWVQRTRESDVKHQKPGSDCGVILITSSGLKSLI